MATILLKKRDTTGAPSAGDLTNSTGGAEVAVNTYDKRIYAKNSGGTVVEIGTDPATFSINSAYTFPTSDGTANYFLQTNGSGALSFAAALTSSDIGSTVQAYDVDTAKLDVAQSFTAQQTFKELKDTVHTISDGAGFEIDPANGSIQTVTLGANRTPAATNFEAGQTVLLGIDDGTAYTITWTTVNPTWVKAGGSGAAPTLATTGFTWVLLWKVGSTIYATEVGQP